MTSSADNSADGTSSVFHPNGVVKSLSIKGGASYITSDLMGYIGTPGCEPEEEFDVIKSDKENAATRSGAARPSSGAVSASVDLTTSIRRRSETSGADRLRRMSASPSKHSSYNSRSSRTEGDTSSLAGSVRAGSLMRGQQRRLSGSFSGASSDGSKSGSFKTAEQVFQKVLLAPQ